MAQRKKKLTDKEKRFCEEYVIDWNATRAAKVAGYSEKTAKEIGCENLTKLNIKKHIDECKNNLEELSGVSALRNINELKKIAYSSIAHLHKTWIKRKEFELLTDEQKECIQEIKTRESYTKQGELVTEIHVKLYDKLKALGTMNRMLGYNAPEKSELELKSNEPIIGIVVK